MKETVAIIGAAGDMGAAVALGLAQTGYRVLLADEIERHALLYVKLHLLACKIRFKAPQADVEVVTSGREASWEADIIVLAIPGEAEAGMASRIKDVVTGKVVISLACPVKGTHDSPISVPAHSVAEELAQLLPHSKIVKAFSTIFAGQPEKPGVAGMSANVFLAGDDKEAVFTVMHLAKDAGYNPLVEGKSNPTLMSNIRHL